MAVPGLKCLIIFLWLVIVNAIPKDLGYYGGNDLPSFSSSGTTSSRVPHGSGAVASQTIYKSGDLSQTPAYSMSQPWTQPSSALRSSFYGSSGYLGPQKSVPLFQNSSNAIGPTATSGTGYGGVGASSFQQVNYTMAGSPSGFRSQPALASNCPPPSTVTVQDTISALPVTVTITSTVSSPETLPQLPSTITVTTTITSVDCSAQCAISAQNTAVFATGATEAALSSDEGGQDTGTGTMGGPGLGSYPTSNLPSLLTSTSESLKYPGTSVAFSQGLESGLPSYGSSNQGPYANSTDLEGSSPSLTLSNYPSGARLSNYPISSFARSDSYAQPQGTSPYGNPPTLTAVPTSQSAFQGVSMNSHVQSMPYEGPGGSAMPSDFSASPTKYAGMTGLASVPDTSPSQMSGNNEVPYEATSDQIYPSSYTQAIVSGSSNHYGSGGAMSSAADYASAPYALSNTTYGKTYQGTGSSAYGGGYQSQPLTAEQTSQYYSSGGYVPPQPNPSYTLPGSAYHSQGYAAASSSYQKSPCLSTLAISVMSSQNNYGSQSGYSGPYPASPGSAGSNYGNIPYSTRGPYFNSSSPVTPLYPTISADDIGTISKSPCANPSSSNDGSSPIMSFSGSSPVSSHGYYPIPSLTSNSVVLHVSAFPTAPIQSQSQHPRTLYNSMTSTPSNLPGITPAPTYWPESKDEPNASISYDPMTGRLDSSIPLNSDKSMPPSGSSQAPSSNFGPCQAKASSTASGILDVS